MKKIYSLIAITGMLLIACEKDVDFIRGNTETTGAGSVPISSNPLTDVATNRTLSTSLTSSTARFTAGSNLNIELQYFSESPIKEVNLYSTVGTGARTKVFTKPYTPSFSAIKRLDTLMIPYQVPANAASNTGIKLDFEIVNVNTLSLTRTGWLRVQ